MDLIDRFERLLDRVLPPAVEAVDLTRRGERHLKAGDVDRALKLAESARALSPRWLPAVMLYVEALTASGRPWDALSTLVAESRERALPPPAQARLASLAAAQGDVPVALEAEARLRASAQGAGPEVADRLLQAARDLRARGLDGASLRMARGATLADPGCSGAWALIAQGALARGDLDRARAAYDRARRAVSAIDGPSNRALGAVALALGDRDAAVIALRRAWLVGETDALGPLVEALEGRDAGAVRAVLASAGAAVGSIVRRVSALAQGAPPANLDDVAGADVPEAVWRWALLAAWRAAPSLAARWAKEAPAREGSAAIVALASDPGDDPVAILRSALAWPPTQAEALDALASTWASRWSADLVVLLDAVSARLADWPSTEAPRLAEALTDLRRELDAPLRVALLGEFSAGKSTFVNALVGAVVSPMGVLPTTAQVHWLRQGERGARVVERSGVTVECPVEDAPRVEARLRASGAEVDHVEVTLPTPTLGRVEVIDTPGTNAGDGSGAALRRALDLADVALWVFDARQAGKESEREALTAARDAGVPAVGVLNKADRLADEERGAVLAALAEGLGALAPCVAALSSRRALEGEADGADDRAVIAWLVDRELSGKRLAWKRARVAVRALAVLDRARAARESSAESTRARRTAREALAEAAGALRESLLREREAVRRAVALAWADQARGLDPDSPTVSEAAAEIVWRERERSLDRLRTSLDRLGALAVTAGVLSPRSTALLRTPVEVWLDHTATLGLADARSVGAPLGALRRPEPATVGAEVGDPLSGLDLALAAHDEVEVDDDPTLDAALALADRVLREVSAPAVSPHPTLRVYDANSAPKA
ncbi:MAG: dynamin family protein [Polyangiales bacterium]